MSVLFVAFDGALHPETANTDELFCCNERLWEILRACPHVEVVFSTSWREVHSFDELVEFVTFGGGEDLTTRFIDVNPDIDISEHRYTREAECRAWLADNNQKHRPWLAIDDIDHWFAPAPNPHLYLVNHETGLTEEDVKAITELLWGEASLFVDQDPDILGGTPVFKGTRVPVAVLFENLAGGLSLEEILDSYPTIPRNAAIAALALKWGRQ